MITLMSIFTFTLSSSWHLQAGAADVATRTRQRKGGTPSTPDDKRKKHSLEIYDFHAV